MDFLLNRRSPLLPRVKETRSQVQVLVQEPDLGRRWNTWRSILSKTHHARWMAKGIYFLKIFLLGDLCRSQTQKRSGVRSPSSSSSTSSTVSRPGFALPAGWAQFSPDAVRLVACSKRCTDCALLTLASRHLPLSFTCGLPPLCYVGNCLACCWHPPPLR